MPLGGSSRSWTRKVRLADTSCAFASWSAVAAIGCWLGCLLTRAACLSSPSDIYKAEGGLGSYALAIHCGGCMIDQQKIRARILDLEASECHHLPCFSLPRT